MELLAPELPLRDLGSPLDVDGAALGSEGIECSGLALQPAPGRYSPQLVSLPLQTLAGTNKYPVSEEATMHCTSLSLSHGRTTLGLPPHTKGVFEAREGQGRPLPCHLGPQAVQLERMLKTYRLVMMPACAVIASGTPLLAHGLLCYEQGGRLIAEDDTYSLPFYGAVPGNSSLQAIKVHHRGEP